MTIRLLTLTLIAAIAIGCGNYDTSKDIPRGWAAQRGDAEKQLAEATAAANVGGNNGETQAAVISTEAATTVPSTAVPESTDQTTTPEITTDPTVDAIAKPINLSGTGDHVSSPFELLSGITLLHATHNGSGEFTIKILGGPVPELSTKTIGAYTGTRIHTVGKRKIPGTGLKPGSYTLGISADGDWTAKITQHEYTRGASIPLSASGRGNGLGGPVMFKPESYTSQGNTAVIPLKVSHNGTGDFNVTVYSGAGMGMDMIILETGVYEGTHSIRIRQQQDINPNWGLSAGTHIIGVEADGDWTIDLLDIPSGGGAHD